MSDYETLLVRTAYPVYGIGTDTTELKRAEEVQFSYRNDPVARKEERTTWKTVRSIGGKEML
jgi:hypothetical protein